MEKSNLIQNCTCIICMNPFDESSHCPLLMKDCGHTFCKECIATHLTANPSSSIIKCFSCRHQSQIDPNDLSLAQFRTNYTVLGFIQQNVSELKEPQKETPPNLCTRHSLPMNLICVDLQNCKNRNPICVKCALQSHKSCSEKLILEVDKLKSVTFVVPILIDTEFQRQKIKENISQKLDEIKNRQNMFVDAAFDAIAREIAFIDSLQNLNVLLENIDKLAFKFDTERNLLVLSHPKNEAINHFYEGLQKCYSTEGMWQKIKLIELDQISYNFSSYLKITKNQTEDNMKLLEKILRTDPFISSNFILPKIDLQKINSLDDFYKELKIVWNLSGFKSASIQILKGAQNRSIGNVLKSIRDQFEKEDHHSNIGSLNHSLYNALNYSPKNWFVKPLGFVCCKISSDFRNVNWLDGDSVILVKINEVCIKVKL